MYCYAQKISGCNTDLKSSQTIIMSVRPCPVLLKISGVLQGKNSSSGLRFKHENIAFIKTTDSTKILWIVLSPNCNMYVRTPVSKTRLHTIMTDESYLV